MDQPLCTWLTEGDPQEGDQVASNTADAPPTSPPPLPPPPTPLPPAGVVLAIEFPKCECLAGTWAPAGAQDSCLVVEGKRRGQPEACLQLVSVGAHASAHASNSSSPRFFTSMLADNNVLPTHVSIGVLIGE